MIKYRIGTEYLDTFNDDQFAVTKAISKIGELDKRHGDRSTGFKVKWTSHNIRLLRYVTVLNSSTSNDGFKKIFGQIVEDDVVISDGYFQVIKFNEYKKDIDVRFYGGNTDWFSDLKDLKINETAPFESLSTYNVNDFNLVIDENSIINNFSNTVIDESNPYKFFLTENGKFPGRNELNQATINTYLDDYQIGFSQGVIFDRIFEGLGVTLKGNMFDDPYYYNTIISASYNLKNKVNETAEGEYNFPALVNKVDGAADTLQQIPYFNPDTLDGQKEPLVFTDNSQAPEWTGTEFTPQDNIDNFSVSAVIKAKVASPSLLDTDRLSYTIYKNDVVFGAENRQARVHYDQGTGRLRYFIIDPQSIGNLTSSDTIRIEYGFDPVGYSPALRQAYLQGNSYINFTFDGSTYSKETEAKELIPELTQSKFVKDVLVQFGAVTQFDSKNKTLTCNKLSIVDDRKIYAPDWTKKVDLSTHPSVDLVKLVSSYSKESYFRYEENDDADYFAKYYKSITNYNFGTGALKIDNSFLEDEKDFYTSPYSPTMTESTYPYFPNVASDKGNMFLPYVPIYTYNGETEEPNQNDLNPRKFLYLQNIDLAGTYKGTVTSINIVGGSTVNYTNMPLVYFDKDTYQEKVDSVINNIYDSLSFGILSDLTVNKGSIVDSDKLTLLDQNYQFQNKILNKPIYLEIYLRLSPIDVQTVDFFTPIWLSYGSYSGHYYIDEISQYKGQDKSTKVKLVRI